MVGTHDWVDDCVVRFERLRKRIRRCNGNDGEVETLRRACRELNCKKEDECIEALDTTAISRAILVGEEMWNNMLKCERSGGLFFRLRRGRILIECRMPSKDQGDDCRISSSAAHKAVIL